LEAINLGDRLFEKMAQFTEGDAKKLAILMENICWKLTKVFIKLSHGLKIWRTGPPIRV